MNTKRKPKVTADLEISELKAENLRLLKQIAKLKAQLVTKANECQLQAEEQQRAEAIRKKVCAAMDRADA